MTVVAVMRRFGQTADEGAFQQALGVQYQIISPGLQLLFQCRNLAPGLCGKRLLAPAAHGHRHHAIDARVQARDISETFFHHPVDLHVRMAGADVVDDRKIVNNVSQ